jgi:alcohol dehydrogenase
VTPFDFRPRTRIVFGFGEFARLGEIARELGGTRCLLIADQSAVDAGHAREAIRSLKARRMEVFAFHDFGSNVSVQTAEAARQYAQPLNPDLIVGLGSRASLDMARAVNIVLVNGGSIRDYWGYGNVPKPLLPMIGVPAEAASGSEAQSSAIFADPDNGAPRLICGDPKLAMRVALLDPKLTASHSRDQTAAGGFEAISQAIESLVSTRRTPLSECFSREAWRLLESSFERVLGRPSDEDARGAMLLGAHFAGLAVEHAALGPAHACVNALVADFKLPGGVAAALLLPSALDWSGLDSGLARRVRELARVADFPEGLREAQIPREALPRLAERAAAQWSGRFSGKRFDAAAALEIYQAAY